ncbi:MAG: fibronectin type III domain-containing protein [Chloroflexota bacterium]|nr:fibronectin type III domain-containing protein [Chloroflexota bacterium]
MALLLALLVGWAPAGAQEGGSDSAVEPALTLKSSTPTSLTVEWDDVNGASSYTIRWRPVGTPTFGPSLPASGGRHRITALLPGRQYVVQVFARGAAGEQLALLRGTFRTYLTSPLGFAVTAASASSLSLAWEKPEGWSPTTYRLRWRRPSDDQFLGSLSLAGSATSRTLTGLEDQTQYVVNLVALNDVGDHSFDANATAWAVDPLTLTLTSSRALCTAGTLTELSWEISGGLKPYRMFIEDQKIDLESVTSHRVNCGPLTIDPQTEEPLPNQVVLLSGTVNDALGSSKGAVTRVDLAPPLPTVSGLDSSSYRSFVVFSWPNQTRRFHEDNDAWYLVRWRAAGETGWNYQLPARTNDGAFVSWAGVQLPSETEQPFVRHAAVARMRNDIEAETPSALNWSQTREEISLVPASGINLTATHDSVTVRWSPQLAKDVSYRVSVGTRDREPFSGASRVLWLDPSDEHEVTFDSLLPSTEYHVRVMVDAYHESMDTEGVSIRTMPPPADYAPLRTGPQNLRLTKVTPSSISVRWDPPYLGASAEYAVYLFRAEFASHPVLFDRGHGQLQARFNDLEPDTDYVVWVTHFGTVRKTARLPVRTPSIDDTMSDSHRQARVDDAQNIEPFPGFEPVQPPRISWPLHFDKFHIMTEDMWTWRGYGFHGGLDVGIVGGSNLFVTRREPVIAAANGLVRLFPYSGSTDRYVVYCPERPGPFYARFVPHDKQDLTEGEGEKKTFECRQVVAPDSGNVALIFHGDPAHGPYFTKYAHLDEFDLAPAAKLRPVALTDEETAYMVHRGEQLGYVGKTGFGIVHEHAHFELRKMPYNRADLSRWRSRDSSDVICDGHVTSYCKWTPGRHVPSFLDPEAHLPPRPAGDSRGEGLRPFSFSSVTPTALEVTATLSLQAWRPPFYVIDSSLGLGYRDQLRGIDFTRPGVDAYAAVARCRDAHSQPLPARLLGRLTGEGPSSVQVRMGIDESCDVSAASRNVAYRLADPPIWSFGRATSGSSSGNRGDLVVVGREYAAPPGPPQAKVSTFKLDSETGTSSATLEGYSYHLYVFSAGNGSEIDLRVETGTIEDVVLHFWQPGAPPTEIDGVLKGTEHLTKSVEEEGVFALLVRGGFIGTNVTPSAGSYTLRYTIPEAICPSSAEETRGSSTASSIPQCPAPVPTPNLAAPPVSAITSSAAKLSWATDEEGLSFELHKVSGDDIDSCDNDLPTNLDDLDTTIETSFTFTGLSANTEYRFCVRSVRTSGEGDDAVTLRSGWASDTGTTLARAAQPADQRRQLETPGTATEWRIVNALACEWRQYTVQTQRNPAVWSTEQQAWVFEEDGWEDDGAATTTWKRTEKDCVTNPGPRTRNKETPTVDKDWRASATTACEYQKFDVQPQTNPGTWSSTAVAWQFPEAGWVDDGDPTTTWKRTKTDCVTNPGPRTRNKETATEDKEWRAPASTACEYQKFDVQPQSNPGTWSSSAEEWRFPEAGWVDDGEPTTKWKRTKTACKTNPGPRTRNKETMTDDKEWRAPGSTACEYQKFDVQPQTNPGTWSSSAVAWQFPEAGWVDDGDPTTKWERTDKDCVTNPGPMTRDHDTPTDETEWRVSGSSACEYQKIDVQPQTNPGTWSSSAEAWQFPEAGWVDDGDPTTKWERTMTACKQKPADDVVYVARYQTQTQTDWETIDDGLFCLQHERKRTRHKGANYRRPHVWSSALTEWVDGTRNAAPFFIDPVYGNWSGWTYTERTRPCSASGQGESAESSGQSTATYRPARLTAGDYHLLWGERGLKFTVPEGTTLELRSRRLDSGVDALVFRTGAGVELAVDPLQLTTDAAQNAALFFSVADSTLSALAGTLRLALATAAATVATEETECASLAADADGTTSVDIDASPCAVVRGGGLVTVMQAERTLSATLPSERGWLVLGARHAESAVFEAIWFVDLQSGAALALSPLDGSEVDRRVVAGDTAGAAHLDEIVASASASAGTTAQ